MKVYCTTYCNKGHVVKTGYPVGHECHVLPPEALASEMAGDYWTAARAIVAAKPMRVSRGVRVED